MKIFLLIWVLAASGCVNDSTEEQKAALVEASAIKKQRVIRQLLEDCKASLPARTYKKAQQLQKEARRPAARRRR